MSFHVLLLDRAGNNLVNADFSLYFRMFFTVKHIYLTLYIVYAYRIAPIYSAPLYLLALLAVPCSLCCSRPPARSVPAARCPCCSLRSLSVLFAALACPRPCAWPCGRARCAVHLLAYVLAALACPRACVRLPMPGQRWTFLSAVPVWPALLARVCARCARLRACARVRGRCPPTFQSLAVHFIRL